MDYSTESAGYDPDDDWDDELDEEEYELEDDE